jgi:hypothetical protein
MWVVATLTVFYCGFGVATVLHSRSHLSQLSRLYEEVK